MFFKRLIYCPSSVIKPLLNSKAVSLLQVFVLLILRGYKQRATIDREFDSFFIKSLAYFIGHNQVV